MTDKSDRDLLIEFTTKTELWYNEVRTLIQNHTKEDVAEFTKLDLKIGAAHKRLDVLVTLKDKILGGVAVIMFLITIGMGIFTILHKGR